MMTQATQHAVTRRCTTLALVLAAWTSVVALAWAADRSGAQILKDLDALVAPTLDANKRQNQAYMRRYLSKSHEVGSKRDALILELYKAAPKHERIPELLGERWGRKQELSTAMSREIDGILIRDKNPKLKAEAVFVKARSKLRGARSGAPDLSMVEEFLKLAPHDPRGATLLELAIERTRGEKAKATLETRSGEGVSGFVLRHQNATTAQAGRVNRPVVRTGVHRRCHRYAHFDREAQEEGRRHRFLGDLVRPVRRRRCPK